MKKRNMTLLIITIAVLFIGITIQPALAGSDAPEKSKGLTGQTTQAMQDQKININTADVETLSSLNGVGPALAQRIIDYRSKSGNFKTIEDLKLVKGIGEKLFLQIEPQITVK